MEIMENLTRVKFTNLEKILFPRLKIKKSEIIEYYISVAPKILKFLIQRPLVMTRFPNGIDNKGFYEKNAPNGTPEWVSTFNRTSKTSEKGINYILCTDLDTLIWLANLAAIEIHTTLSTINYYENPDLILFDIDPELPATFNDAIEVSLLLKEQLDALSLRSYIKTSGKKGLHVVIPVLPLYSYKQTREYVHQIGRYLVGQSDLIVSEFSQTKEPGKVFIDFMQNHAGRTMICPYSLRANENATVSIPLEWQELKKKLKPEDYNIFSVRKIEENPWENIFEERQKLEVE